MLRRQTESDKEIKQNERRRKRHNLKNEDIDLGRFFELATSNKIYVNNLNLHEIKDEILQGYTSDFDLFGKLIFGPIEHIKQLSDLKKWMILKNI